MTKSKSRPSEEDLQWARDNPIELHTVRKRKKLQNSRPWEISREEVENLFKPHLWNSGYYDWRDK